MKNSEECFGRKKWKKERKKKKEKNEKKKKKQLFFEEKESYPYHEVLMRFDEAVFCKITCVMNKNS